MTLSAFRHSVVRAQSCIASCLQCSITSRRCMHLVRLQPSRINLEWTRTNQTAHTKLVAKMRQVLRRAGFPLVLSRAFDNRTPSHQCGTVRLGSDPGSAPLDPFCRSHDHANLFVVDASFLPSSAAVNPSLTIAAQALRVAHHIRTEDFRA